MNRYTNLGQATEGNMFNQAAEYEQRMLAKARELVSGQDPAFNIAPTLELVKMADRMGYDVVKRR